MDVARIEQITDDSLVEESIFTSSFVHVCSPDSDFSLKLDEDIKFERNSSSNWYLRSGWYVVGSWKYSSWFVGRYNDADSWFLDLIVRLLRVRDDRAFSTELPRGAAWLPLSIVTEGTSTSKGLHCEASWIKLQGTLPTMRSFCSAAVFIFSDFCRI